MAEIKVRAPIAGSVWQIAADVGQRVDEDEAVIILESMKMEIPVVAPRGGTVTSILVATGQVIAEEDVVALIETD